MNPKRLFYPAEFQTAPTLRSIDRVDAPRRRYALLVNPFYFKDPRSSFGKHVLTPSLALTSIAGSTPADWEVRYWDENLLQGPPPSDPLPQVVGITVHLTFARRAYEISRWFRDAGTKVILGGLHVLSCPDEARPHADALALGEGVQVWPEILDDVERGELKETYHGSYRRPYRDDPPPRRQLLDRKSFLTTSSMIATRGCHNRCGFCYLSTQGLRLPYLKRDVEQVVDEFKGNGEPYGVFIDNNLGPDRDYLRQLCRGLRPLEKTWSAAVTLDVTDDSTLVREMALSGCTGVFIGFESLNDQNIEDANKKSPKAREFAERIELLHRYGIQVNGSFVLGFDHDTTETFDVLVNWIESVQMECATFHLLTPYPGPPSLSTDGQGGAHPTQELGRLRHSTRGL
jgi:radical SAM superfamily enzyme YgiQ (UPF0313 family)